MMNQMCVRSEEHTSELQSLRHLVCRLLLEITIRSEEHTSELQSLRHLVCRLLLEHECPSSSSAINVALRHGLFLKSGKFKNSRVQILSVPRHHYFFFNERQTTGISTLPLHDALPI